MTNETLLTRLRRGDLLLCDGAMGTMLHEQGLQPGECPESWCVSRPDAVRRIAEAYIAAGSDIVETNTFGCNSCKLAPYALADRVSEFNHAAVALARAATGTSGYVAGSVGPSGKILTQEGGETSGAELYDVFKEQCVALAEGGADFLLIETMSSLLEAVQAITAAKENTTLPVACTFTFQKHPKGFRTMMGLKPDRAATEAVNAGADVVGANCSSGIDDMTEIAREMRSACPAIPLLIQPNAGAPVFEDGKTVFKQSPEHMASLLPELLKAGAQIVGGCCGTTPAHIAALAQVLKRTPQS